MSDEIFGFLIFVGIMIISIVHNKRKEAVKQATKKVAPKAPRKIVVHNHTIPTAKSKPASKKQNSSMVMPGDRTTSAFTSSQKVVTEQPEEETPNFSFQSLDDVKRAFVWSEILQRKY